MGSNSIPPKTLEDESINRGLVCAHMHFIARTQKILTFMSLTVNASNKNTPSTHHPRRRNVTTLMVGFKKRSHMQKSHPKMVNPRDIAGERRRRRKRSTLHFDSSLIDFDLDSRSQECEKAKTCTPI